MDYLSNLLGKKKGSSSPSSRGGGHSNNNSDAAAAAVAAPPETTSFLESKQQVDSSIHNNNNTVISMGGQDAPPTATFKNEAGYAATAATTSVGSTAAAAPSAAAAAASPAPAISTTNTPTKKKLIAIMTDSSTKTVRVSVNNEEVVITARDLEEDCQQENSVTGVAEGRAGGEGGMMTIMGEGMERSTTSVSTSSNELLGGGPKNSGMESNYSRQNNIASDNTTVGGPPLSRQTSTSSNDGVVVATNAAAGAGTNGENGGTSTSANNNNNNSAAPPSSTSNEQRPDGTRKEASLLLGIAENLIGIPGVDEDGNPKREPGGDLSTLPSSMTSFLDMLTEDQRRKRHRYIPAVEGFRRLYKNEIKVDMAAARVLNRKRREFDPNATTVEDIGVLEENEAVEREKAEKEADAMMDEVGGGEDGSDNNNSSSNNKNGTSIAGSDKDSVPDKMTFIVPSEDALSLANGGRLASLMVNTPLETTAAAGVSTGASSSYGGGGGGPVPRSPQLVDSLTAFNPPRPQESTAAKTKHRLKRWEANPSEVETDLSNYRKTVQRTRKELQAAENERGRIELVSAVMREHFQKHLIAYKEEIMAVNDQLLETNMACLKAGERYNVGRSMSLRGSGKSMKDVLVTLKGLEDELKNASASSSSGGGGGSTVSSALLSSEKSLDWRVPGVGGVSTPGSKAEMASGWILEGDNVVITPSGEEGQVIEVKVVQALDDKKEDAAGKKQGEDAMDVDKANESEKKESAVVKSVNGADGKKSADAYALVEKISVRLSNGDVKVLNSSELKFNPKKLPTLTHVNKALGKRWSAMLKTAEAVKHSHDLSAMENYINASFATDDSEDGNDAPVTNDDDCLVASFGSDMLAAPESVREFPSVIPPDVLEETVRKVVYETTTPRIIPDIPADLKKYESQKEELNRYQATVMQLRHRLGRQKRLRRFNERTLAEGNSRSHKVENLLLEMQMDLKNLKERLHGELSELGISNAVLWNGNEHGGDAPREANGETHLATASTPTIAEVGLISNVETTMEPESKRIRVE